MEIHAEKLEELIEKYIELVDNETPEEDLDDLAHEIDHEVFNNNFYIILNKINGETEVAALSVDDEDSNYFLPAYTSEKEANKAIEIFTSETEGECNFELEVNSGEEIIAKYSEDEDFLGLAINAPETEFVVYAETVHDCCDE